LPSVADEFRYRRVELTGHYDTQAQVLLDNSTHEGLVGYQVVTPFIAAGADRAVAVNRGWVPASPDRTVLPEVAVDSSERILRARIDRLPVPALRLGQDARVPAGHLHVLSFPQHSDLERALDRPLFSYVLLLEDGEADGYRRDWGPPGPGAERNLAYAGQWFLLAAVSLLAGLGIPLRRAFVGRRGS
jgi:surfeit locus 1 family protein